MVLEGERAGDIVQLPETVPGGVVAAMLALRLLVGVREEPREGVALGGGGAEGVRLELWALVALPVAVREAITEEVGEALLVPEDAEGLLVALREGVAEALTDAEPVQEGVTEGARDRELLEGEAEEELDSWPRASSKAARATQAAPSRRGARMPRQRGI